IDLSILYDVDLVSAIDRRRLTDCQPYILLPPGHPLAASGGDVDLYALLDEPYIQMDVLPGRDDYIFSVLGIKPHLVVQRTTNFELVRALVARGFGYSILVQRPSIDLTYDGLPIATRAIANPV
ncbi:LysR family transcriptional regulator, partial [Mycobacterium tuberculosis]|nr:LysR family transcriptional regulator [Mycobacterium tuberculosis]